MQKDKESLPPCICLAKIYLTVCFFKIFPRRSLEKLKKTFLQIISFISSALFCCHNIAKSKFLIPLKSTVVLFSPCCSLYLELFSYRVEIFLSRTNKYPRTPLLWSWSSLLGTKAVERGARDFPETSNIRAWCCSTKKFLRRKHY